jgi:cobalt/nickel transport system permease protein
VHIADGYLSPAFSLGTGAVTVPAWALGLRRLQRTLDSRTVPLLAVLSALCFVVALFDVPVPGGTTAHAVGGALIAIVLGPWAAATAVSVAVIVQALFFGDGGVLAIPVNCLNNGLILPFVGYATYRLLAGGASPASRRTVWAAAAGGYVGLTVAALAAGVELGVQPGLFKSASGQPLYNPYPLTVAVPAMLVTHCFGASIVEALVTGLGVAFLNRHHPELLQLRAGAVTSRGTQSTRPYATLGAAAVCGLAAVGLVSGDGRPARAFGLDWSAVRWADVGLMLAVMGAVAAVLVPWAHLVLPRGARRAGALLVGLAALTPAGLIVPRLAGLSVIPAPLRGYDIPVPFFDAPDAPLWHRALGYEASALVGIVLLGSAALLAGRVLLRRRRDRRPSSAAARGGSPADGG